MHQVDDITGGPHDDPFAAGVSTAAHGDNTWDCPDVSGDFWRIIFQSFIDQYLFGTFTGDLRGIFLEKFFLHIGRFPLHQFLCFSHNNSPFRG